MKRTIILSISLIFVFVSHAFPCFSPTDIFATEVVLSKPGVRYDLELIGSAANVSFEEGAFIYRSHFDKRVAVILRELGDKDPIRGLSVRVQIPTKSVMKDGVEDLAEAVDIAKDEFDFKSAMKIELDWLKTNGIIDGVDERDFAEIAEISKAGLAGWNARIVHEKGKWLPYNETANPTLIRGVDCGGFSLEKLQYDETIILPAPSSVSFNGKLATSWGEIKTGF